MDIRLFCPMANRHNNSVLLLFVKCHGCILKPYAGLGMLADITGGFMDFLRLDHFAPHLNETFMVEIDRVRTPFVLVEARPLPYRPAPGLVREPFSLLFRNEAAIVFPQGTYNMSNPGMGDI